MWIIDISNNIAAVGFILNWRLKVEVAVEDAIGDLDRNEREWLLKKKNEMQRIGITIEQQMEEEGKKEREIVKQLNFV